ncbi:hypothetical protein BDV19DRAFT_375125 [Aspergillus venezuelensis]
MPILQQQNRPPILTGKPYINYNCPPTGVQDYGIKFNMELFKSLQDNTYNWTPPTGTFNRDPQHIPEGVKEIEYNGELGESS